MALIVNGKQISPCIFAKVKFALDLPNVYNGNNKKTCSQKYWDKVVGYFGKIHNLTTEKNNTGKKKDGFIST